MSNCVHIDTWPRDDSLAGFFMAVPFWEKHPEIPSGPGGTATLNFSSHRDDAIPGPPSTLAISPLAGASTRMRNTAYRFAFIFPLAVACAPSPAEAPPAVLTPPAPSVA